MFNSILKFQAFKLLDKLRDGSCYKSVDLNCSFHFLKINIEDLLCVTFGRFSTVETQLFQHNLLNGLSSSTELQNVSSYRNPTCMCLFWGLFILFHWLLSFLALPTFCLNYDSFSRNLNSCIASSLPCYSSGISNISLNLSTSTLISESACQVPQYIFAFD